MAPAPLLGFLWLVPALPLAGFTVLAIGGRSVPRGAASAVGVGSVALAAALAAAIAAAFLSGPPSGGFDQMLWRWMDVAGFAPAVGLRLDALSLVMMLVVTFVGALIHLYSTEFMAGDEGYGRYFAYMNLFVAAMLVLVLADNLLLLYLGWEGVGMCSYLLIGFWYQDPANGAAARKAFIVSRVGDAAMAVGLFLLATRLGTLEIQPMLARAAEIWTPGDPVAVWAAALLLGGAVGKSAQLPLQTWLPDAMAGPTPVSALIHAATMVTAGVYLIARTHVLFELAPDVQAAVAAIGAATLLLGAFAALAQTDIKRILAYSTISQIGYMFLALGVGAWSAAIFHLVTHAFFKALLFLAAGGVIMCLHHEHDVRRMGGLRRQIPVVFWAFLIGGAALAALPLVTAGFYSKDLILLGAWSSPAGGRWLWAAGAVGAFVTAVYIFRAAFVVFFGEATATVDRRPGIAIALPLVVLSVLSLAGGAIELPAWIGGVPALSDFLGAVLPEARQAPAPEGVLVLVSALLSVLGIAAGWLLYRLRGRQFAVVPPSLAAFARGGLGFDRLYDLALVRPVRWFAHANRDDVVDGFYDGVALTAQLAHRLLSRSQDGRLRWYASGIALGGIAVVAIAVLA